MRRGERVFVDTGAWVALALTRDPYHDDAKSTWETLREAGARLFTSIPVVLETFTFLDRNTERAVALRWKDELSDVPRLRVLEGTMADVTRAWAFFAKGGFHKLSAVDATSFVMMEREKIRTAFAFDRHFSTAGFRLAG